MKKLCIVLAVAFLAGISGLDAIAQPPRLRTSAPPEQTARKGDGKKESRQTAAASTPTAISTPSASASYLFGYNALKTDVAYDIFGILNIAYEFQVARHWTVEIPVMWSLWDWKDSRGVRVAGVQPGAKYWFCAPGRGNALGADFDLLWYNVRWNDRRYQVAGRPAMGFSLVYAYSLNLGRGWNAEFSLGVGYVNTRYNTYYNIDDGALIDTKTKNYFGPTRIGLTLVYSL